MNEIIKELTTLGKEINQAKTNISQLEGREAEILNRLKEEFGISTLGELETEILANQAKLETLEEQIQSEFADLKEKFQW